ncbi:MAG: methyltransferase domain-containing protein [Anaerolineae bacterium]|nr:methyltransferase domain-containing protein [Anaerolineae bacterium]
MTNDTQIGYDRVAEQYAESLFHELDYKPFDRHLLMMFAEMVKGHGLVCDIGCGPGQIARYLHDRGADAMGVDLSPEMIKQAQQLNPGQRFEQADMRALPFGMGELAGITAFYSVIHIPRPDVISVLQEFRRVLKFDGWLLLAFHLGDEVLHRDEFFDKPVSLDFTFFQLAEMRKYLGAAGFTTKIVSERSPYSEEHQSHRGYLLAQNIFYYY